MNLILTCCTPAVQPNLSRKWEWKTMPLCHDTSDPDTVAIVGDLRVAAVAIERSNCIWLMPKSRKVTESMVLSFNGMEER